MNDGQDNLRNSQRSGCWRFSCRMPFNAGAEMNLWAVSAGAAGGFYLLCFFDHRPQNMIIAAIFAATALICGSIEREKK